LSPCRLYLPHQECFMLDYHFRSSRNGLQMRRTWYVSLLHVPFKNFLYTSEKPWFGPCRLYLWEETQGSN